MVLQRLVVVHVTYARIYTGHVLINAEGLGMGSGLAQSIDMSAKYGVNRKLDRMWTCRTILGTVLIHFVSSGTVLDMAANFMDHTCISLQPRCCQKAEREL